MYWHSSCQQAINSVNKALISYKIEKIETSFKSLGQSLINIIDIEAIEGNNSVNKALVFQKIEKTWNSFKKFLLKVEGNLWSNLMTLKPL